MTDHIVLYGKGGVGKSTLISNICAALAEAGFGIMQVGCDPRADSCNTLSDGRPIPTVFDRLRKQQDISTETVVHRGFKGVSCMELGDPSGVGLCASEEIARAFRVIESAGIFEAISPDFVFYDISGESSCAGFHTAIRLLDVRRVFVVTSADFMSLRAANGIFSLLTGSVGIPALPVGGLIPNGIGSSFEESFIQDFAHHTGTHTLTHIPCSLMVRQCELYGKTVIEAAPLSNQSYFYRRLANQIVDESRTSTVNGQPHPLTPDQLGTWARGWGDQLHALEHGLVTDGAAI
ncbi:nitrogenase iron protein [Geobacter sp. AOG1]|uniref:nucleotide-binding protein n=1 Tax=Geobacter sp. AOG1 TaxID=1566346 RepID=UPI001CC3507F|nr:nitrogenase iron protein [Geobacter sp. AOG1]GFE56755.1 nitrogenase iron protein [Geobacter sp. AOG1]